MISKHFIIYDLLICKSAKYIAGIVTILAVMVLAVLIMLAIYMHRIGKSRVGSVSMSGLSGNPDAMNRPLVDSAI